MIGQDELLAFANDSMDCFRADPRFWLCRFTKPHRMADLPYVYAYCDILSVEPETKFFRHTCSNVRFYADGEWLSNLDAEVCRAYECALALAMKSGYLPIPQRLESFYRGLGCGEPPPAE